MSRFLRRMHHWLNRGRLERELADEMSAHREMMPPDRRGAFGDPRRLCDQSREIWGWLWFDQICQDAIYAVRGFIRDRRFTLSAIGAIVLAVGAATAVFSVVDRSLFRPLPYRHGDRLVSVEMMAPQFGPGGIMFSGAYRDWRASQSAVDLTSWSGVAECDLGGDTPERLHCARAEATFLPLLGVDPYLGRAFVREEDQEDAEPVALVSYRLWRSHYGADAGVLGRKITLDGAVTRIIGVLPSNFETPDLAPADFLVPQMLPEGPHTQNYEVRVVGRLRRGVTTASAAAALAGPFERFRLDFGRRVGINFAESMKLRVQALRDQQIQQFRLAMWVLLGAVTAFVLIACASVANLLMARLAGRRQEFAIRTALGGSRSRLVAQLLTESTLLGLVGGAAGCGLAWLLIRMFIALAPEGTLRIREAALDTRVLGFALVLSLGTALVFGMAPALGGLRSEDLRGAGESGRAWVRHVLISAQLALSLILLAGAGLLLTSLWHLKNTPLGFRSERVVTASFTLPKYRYGTDLQRTGWSVRQMNFFEELMARLKEIPGAVATAITDSMPPGPATRTIPSQAPKNPGSASTDRGEPGSMGWRYVSPDYFQALGIPIRRGRSFSEADRAPGVNNIVVNESLARLLVREGDLIGTHFVHHTIIGVAADSRNAGLDTPPRPEFFVVRQRTGDGVWGSTDEAWWRRGTAIVRSNLDEQDAAELLQVAIRRVDPTVPLKIETMKGRVETFLTRPRFDTALLSWFALAGLALAGVGLYGLISFLVVQRTREIGIRMALGATAGESARLVVWEAARWTALGVAIGTAGAAGSLRFLKGLLYQVEILDLRVFAAAVGVLAGAAIWAAWLPAYRASRIDPAIALRHE